MRKLEKYEEKMIALVEAGKLPRAAVSFIDVKHDSWCSKLRGGHCTCDPDIYWKGKLLPVPAV